MDYKPPDPSPSSIRPMRFCYADPPYPGMAHLYKNHPDYAGEVDHKALIERLVAEFPDGWALSTATPTLKYCLSLCPSDVRILAWIKPDAPFHPQQRLRYAWEPVIIRRGRNHPERCDDFISTPKMSGAMNVQKILGGKPDPFCFWLFRCLGALPGDEMVDMFPGSGAVGRAWDKYQRQIALPLPKPPYVKARLDGIP